ncbi:MAG TPA: ABC transporter substrate-binding protein [Usitatibacter sp.]|nr:ABC transporter substrate-binding protein [Usitatibacter sp.]
MRPWTYCARRRHRAGRRSLHKLKGAIGLLSGCAIAALALSTHAADPDKVLRFAFQIAEATFDPAIYQDQYSSMVVDHILDPMLTYDYLARPVKLVPNTLDAMPEVSADGLTYTFRVRKGIYFTPHPAFKGKPRELVAADYAYSILRFFDPKVKSPNLYLIENRILGLDEAHQRALRDGKPFDYDAAYPGLQVLDRHSLRIRLKAPDYTLLYNLAQTNFGAVAREVAELYGDDIGSHPVGTGPYLLKHWTRGHRIVLEANPGFRELVLPMQAAEGSGDEEILREIGGKRLPLIGRIEIHVVEENQPRWLSFLNGDHDVLQWLPNEFIHVVAPRGELAPYLARRGIGMHAELQPRTGYTYFNFDDPVVGGYEPHQVALRRAISMAYDMPEEIRILRKGQAIPAQGPIPPGVEAYDPEFRSPTLEHNPSRAKALLDMFGFVDRDGDGHRERPDGSPLQLELASRPDQESRQYDELWRRSMDAVGLRIRFKKGRFADFVRESNAGTLQMWNLSWSAGSPDADFWMGLFYGPNAGKSNDSRMRLAPFDRMYERSRGLPGSPERTQLYREMTKLLLVYAPWVFHVHHISTHLVQPWVKGYKKHPFRAANWRYLDIVR